jgi:hypothetical protein
MRSLLFGCPPLTKSAFVAMSFCVMCISAAYGGVVINEIYYDHPGMDDGYEFIELFNNDNVDLCIESFLLEFHNGSGNGWELLWRGSSADTIRARALFVVGGECVSPEPDAVLRMSIQNGPDAVCLKANDHVFDLVGYGCLEDEEYVEGTSAGKVSAGYSLCRKPDGWDSDNNQADFHSMIPSPGGFNVPEKDVSLALTEGTSGAGTVETGALDDIRFLLLNNGTAVIPAGEVSVQLRDSSLAGTPIIGEGANMDGIDAGSSHEMVYTIGFVEGYHFLTLHADYAEDERPDNNRIDLVRRAGSPHILISEVMSCPAEPCPQYIEIFNAGGEAYNLNEHVIRDKSHAYSLLTSQECVIEPGAYFVVTPVKKQLLSFFPELPSHRVVEAEGTWPTLNHSGSGGLADSILIGDRFGIPVEAVDYPPQSSDQCARSLERVDLFASTRSPVWILSKSPRGGSPGQPNEASLLTTPGDAVLTVKPNPFSPSAGEKLLIVVEPPHPDARTTVAVFDTKGRIIKTVGSSRVHPYVYIWDGSREDGSAAPSGLYILACEMASSNGKRLGVKKVVVGCGKKRR